MKDVPVEKKSNKCEGPFTITEISNKIIVIFYINKVKEFNISFIFPIPPAKHDPYILNDTEALTEDKQFN